MIVPCGASVWPRAVQEDVDHLRGVLNWSIGLYWAGVLPPAAGPELPTFNLQPIIRVVNAWRPLHAPRGGARAAIRVAARRRRSLAA